MAILENAPPIMIFNVNKFELEATQSTDASGTLTSYKPNTNINTSTNTLNKVGTIIPIPLVESITGLMVIDHDIEFSSSLDIIENVSSLSQQQVAGFKFTPVKTDISMHQNRATTLNIHLQTSRETFLGQSFILPILTNLNRLLKQGFEISLSYVYKNIISLNGKIVTISIRESNNNSLVDIYITTTYNMDREIKNDDNTNNQVIKASSGTSNVEQYTTNVSPSSPILS